MPFFIRIAMSKRCMYWSFPIVYVMFQVVMQRCSVHICWWILSIMHCWEQVYQAFRGNGGDRRLKQEVAGAVATHAARGAATRV